MIAPPVNGLPLVSIPTLAPMRDARNDNVKFFLPCDGEDGSRIFIDRATRPNVISAVDSPKIVTDETSPYGTSAFFDGSGGYLSVEMGAGFQLADFTLEFWTKPLTFASSGANRCPVSFGTTLGAVLFNTNGTFMFYANGSILASQIPLVLDTWQHVAFSRSAGVLKVFVDGVLAGSVANSMTLGYQTMLIGQSLTSAGEYSGYLRDIRVSTAAWYTQSFTPKNMLLPAKRVLFL